MATLPLGRRQRDREGEDCAASAAARWPFVRVVAGLRLRRRCLRCSGSAATISSLGRIPQHNVSLICWILFALPPPSSLSAAAAPPTPRPVFLARTHTRNYFVAVFSPCFSRFFVSFLKYAAHTHTYIHMHEGRAQAPRHEEFLTGRGSS